MQQYFYLDASNKAIGPIAYTDLARLHKAGQILAETNVVEDGGSEWKPFSSIKDPDASSPEIPPAALPQASRPFVENQVFVTSTSTASTAAKRYSDAYLVARSVIGVGRACKLIAILLGVGVAIGFPALTGQFQGQGMNQHDPSIFVLGIAIGFILAVPFFVLGILVEAAGQILQASLDSAVHTSPFLNKEQMASAMKIR